MLSSSLRSAQTWSQGHLRSLASDACAAALKDSGASKLEVHEGGVSPWKGDQVCWCIQQKTGQTFDDACLFNPAVH